MFSGKAQEGRNIDLAKLNKITFGDNSMVISPSKSNGEKPVELQYALYHHLEIGDAVPTGSEAESITLSQTSATLKVGQSLTLTATVKPENTKDKTVTWRSSDKSIATVDAGGNVAAVGIGKTTITAACGSVSAICEVTVEAMSAESIYLSQTTATLKVGETLTLTATVFPESATNKTVTWSSSNESVAKVSADGKVSALAVGETTITALCGSVSASCFVTVEDSNGIETVGAESARIFVDTAKKLLYLESTPDAKFNIGVFNAAGYLLLTSELVSGDTMNLESLVPGVYIAVASDGITQLTLKFTIN